MSDGFPRNEGEIKREPASHLLLHVCSEGEKSQLSFSAI